MARGIAVKIDGVVWRLNTARALKLIEAGKAEPLGPLESAEDVAVTEAPVIKTDDVETATAPERVETFAVDPLPVKRTRRKAKPKATEAE